jgi:hypothetical protein
MNKITRDDTEHGVEYVRADKAQAEIEIMRMKTQAGIQMEQERNSARIAMEDAKAAADIRRKGYTQQP